MEYGPFRKIDVYGKTEFGWLRLAATCLYQTPAEARERHASFSDSFTVEEMKAVYSKDLAVNVRFVVGAPE